MIAAAATTSLRRVLAFLATLAVLATPLATPAHADNGWSDRDTGWSKCSWNYKDAGVVARKDVTVGTRGFPNAEFRDRVRDATVQWDSVSTKWGMSHRNHSNVDILFDYVLPTDVRIEAAELLLGGQFNAYTFTTLHPNAATGALGTAPSYSLCIAHGGFAGNFLAAHIESALILVTIRDDWFTRPNADRTYWEQLNCVQDANSPTGWRATNGTRGASQDNYLCQKVGDMGGLAVHELGHAVGLAHPRDVDALTTWRIQCSAPIFGNANRCAASRAHCREPNVASDRKRTASMCAGQDGRQSTARRTLAHYDIESLRYHDRMNPS